MEEQQRRGSCTRMNYIKRVFAVLLCAVILVGVVMPPKPAKAILGVIAIPAVASLIAELAVTCGVTYMVASAVDPSINDIYGKLDTVTQQDIYDAAHSGELQTTADGDYQYVCNVDDSLWGKIKAAIDELYDPGINELEEEVQSNVSLDGQAHIVSLPFYIYYTNGYNPVLNYYCYISAGEFHIERYENGVLNYSNVYSNVKYMTFTYDNVNNNRHFILNMYDSSNHRVTYFTGIYMSSVTQEDVIVVGEVIGGQSVDDPDWDWSNRLSEEKDVVMIPDVIDGKVTYDETGAVSIDYEATKEAVLEKTADDLAVADVGGIAVPAEEAIPTEGVTDTPAEVVEGSESGTSLKALLFSRFPFCLPWDLKNAFSLLLAEPQAPSWNIDLVPAAIKQQCGISADTTWHINMDGMEVVGKVIRWTSTISFCLALIIVTRRIIKS